MVDEKTLGVVASLDLLETLVVTVVQTRAPFRLGKLGVSIVDEATELSTTLDKSFLEGFDAGSHVGDTVAGVSANTIGIPSDQPEVLSVGIGSVAVLDRPGDTAPEVHVSELGHVGTVESKGSALKEDLGLLDGKRVVGGGSQRLSVEGSASESSTVGQVHTGASDRNFQIPPGKDSALDRNVRVDSLELLDKRGHDAVKLVRVTVEVTSAIVRRSVHAPAESPGIGAVLAQGVVLNGN